MSCGCTTELLLRPLPQRPFARLLAVRPVTLRGGTLWAHHLLARARGCSTFAMCWSGWQPRRCCHHISGIVHTFQDNRPIGLPLPTAQRQVFWASLVERASGVQRFLHIAPSTGACLGWKAVAAELVCCRFGLRVARQVQEGISKIMRQPAALGVG